MGQTPIYNLPYPILDDPDNVPADIKKLADRIEVVLPTFQAKSERAQANGYASLDASGKVPFSQLPDSATTPELAYVEFVATVSVTAASEAAAQTIVTAPSLTVNGTQVIEIAFYSADVNTGGTGQFFFAVFDGAQSTGIAAKFDTSNDTPLYFARRLRPSAGAHIFSIRAWRPGGTGTVVAGPGGAGQTVPGYMRIMRGSP
jgi:hypothetical protein